MTAVSGSQMILLDRWIDLATVDLVTAGVVTGLNPKPGHEADVMSKMLAPHEHARCWRKSEIPARLHYGSNARVPAVVCVADDGWRIETQSFVDRPDHRENGGEHGYDNEDPKMRALFVAHGPAFKQGLDVPEFANVNVYPLLAYLLGIKPQPNDGDLAVTRGMLRH
jgi:predicted AlkP superfamily pyrophosphatase or phosphodiesterase